MESNLERAVRLHDEFLELEIAADPTAKLEELRATTALLTPGELLDFHRETAAPEYVDDLDAPERPAYRQACRIPE